MILLLFHSVWDWPNIDYIMQVIEEYGRYPTLTDTDTHSKSWNTSQCNQCPNFVRPGVQKCNHQCHIVFMKQWKTPHFLYLLLHNKWIVYFFTNKISVKNASQTHNSEVYLMHLSYIRHSRTFIYKVQDFVYCSAFPSRWQFTDLVNFSVIGFWYETTRKWIPQL